MFAFGRFGVACFTFGFDGFGSAGAAGVEVADGADGAEPEIDSRPTISSAGIWSVKAYSSSSKVRSSSSSCSTFFLFL